jgi:nitroimidazol reductase NimA-like FMN-containing flavoprotein (pyridoxamine 5'-phosphate oxidase superfamily)
MSRDQSISRKNKAIYQDPQINRVRKEELAVDDEAWIKALLHRGAYGTIATAAGAQPFLNAHNYVYDESQNCIYFHRNPVGRTSANLEVNPQVCYQVVEMGRMYAGKNALDFGVEYRSVVVFGTARRVELEEAAHALRLLMQKYAPHLEFGVDYAAFEPQCPNAAAVYRVDITQWSGKKSEVTADHPGAYDYLEKRQEQA